MVRLFRLLLGFACLALSAPIMAADSNISDLERNALLQARLAQYITSLSAEDGGFRYLDRQGASIRVEIKLWRAAGGLLVKQFHGLHLLYSTAQAENSG